MDTKKNPRARLENYSQQFMLIGLALALFLISVSLEYKTFTKEITKFRSVELSVEPMEEMIITHRKQPPIKYAPPPPPKLLEVIKIVENISEITETIIETTETDETEAVIISVDIELINEIVEYEEIIEDVPFAVIENIPIFPGCDYGNKEDKISCFSKNIRKHIYKEFDLDIANKLGLPEGKKKIFVMFTIDIDGNITEVQARAPHPRLEIEAKRVILSLPKMIPGKQRGVPVRVKYSLPITFEVHL